MPRRHAITSGFCVLLVRAFTLQIQGRLRLAGSAISKRVTAYAGCHCFGSGIMRSVSSWELFKGLMRCASTESVLIRSSMSMRVVLIALVFSRKMVSFPFSAFVKLIVLFCNLKELTETRLFIDLYLGGIQSLHIKTALVFSALSKAAFYRNCKINKVLNWGHTVYSKLTNTLKKNSN